MLLQMVFLPVEGLMRTVFPEFKVVNYKGLNYFSLSMKQFWNNFHYTVLLKGRLNVPSKLKTSLRYILLSFYNYVEVQLKSKKLHIFQVCSLISFAIYSQETTSVRIMNISITRQSFFVPICNSSLPLSPSLGNC